MDDIDPDATGRVLAILESSEKGVIYSCHSQSTPPKISASIT